MMTRQLLVYALWLGGTAIPVSAAESMESLEKKLDEVSSKVASVTCVQKVVLNSDMGQGNSLTSDIAGEYSFLRQGDRVMWRWVQKGTQVQKAAGTEHKMDIDGIDLDDGVTSWKLVNRGGNWTAFKMKAQFREQSWTIAGRALFDELRQDQVLEVRPDQQVDGVACYVVEGTPKIFVGKLKPGEATTQYFIRQDTGLVVKIVTNDLKGQPAKTTTRTEVTINAPVSTDLFKPPPGMKIVE